MMKCGGTGEQHAAGEEECKIVAELKGDVEKRTGKSYSTFEAVAVKTQVVAGTNYFIKVRVGDGDYIHLRVFKPLPYTDEPIQLIGVQEGKSESDPIDYFQEENKA
ncbi:cystatin-B-like [Lineus longissimus]|uniref:cystatin-B-like n=1 Tax=Lineus longissimus TaxID=88925 RepID=UPI002B4CDA6E